MLFNHDNYPIAVRVLADLGFAARTRDGRSTVPNLMALFNLIFPKNEETYTYAVSLLIAACSLYVPFQIIPMFLEVFQSFYPNDSAKVAINEYLNFLTQHKWSYANTVSLYR